EARARCTCDRKFVFGKIKETWACEPNEKAPLNLTKALRMNQEQLLVGLKKDVRSLLVSSKHGLTPEQLKRDYQTMLGYPIPLRLLGFRNVMDMVREMPDVVHLEFQYDGNIILKAIGDETTRGIEELVCKQRDHKGRPGIRRGKPGNFHITRPCIQPVILPRRGQAKPVLPAQLCCQLKQLLSHGPIRLSELESRYMLQFGKPLLVTQYGFYSISEMLSAAMDFIVMLQSRTGSLLVLRCPVKPRFPTLRPTNQFMPPKQNVVGFNPKVVPPPQKNINVSSEPPSIPKVTLVKEEKSFEETVVKLEEDLRQQILEKGTAGIVSDELKDKLRKVVAENVNGISIYNLPSAYKQMFGEELAVNQCGFLSVTEMVGALSDTLSIQRPADANEKHWIVKIDSNDTISRERDLSPGHGTISSPSSESQSPCKKGHYFSCPESAWELEGTKQLSEESEPELRVTNKTIHEMVNLFPELRVSSATAIPLDALRSQNLKPPVRRMERELLPILVEKMESPNYFFIRFSQNKEARALENMMIEMRSCYSYPQISERYRLHDSYVRPGQVCCVAPRDMWFYRVVIHEVLSATEVKVACYADLPAQAVPAMLAGIRPITSTWTQSAISSLQKMCLDRTLVGAVHGYQDDFLMLFLCDTSTEEDVYVHLALQREGHALLCSPFYELVSDKFNPVTSYFRNGPLENIESFRTKSSISNEVPSQGKGAQKPSQIRPNCEQGEIPNLDLPALEPINNQDVDSQANTKDSLFDIEWDQGWTVEDKTKEIELTDLGPDSITDQSNSETVCPPPHQAAVSEEQMGESPGQLMPASTTNTSSNTPVLIQINCNFQGVPVCPVQPPLSQFRRNLLGSPMHLRERSNSAFQQLTSPLTLRPSACMSAGASLPHSSFNQIA
ncbi:hypothetical protein DNTS_001527, partial [Danionella cerebrum]